MVRFNNKHIPNIRKISNNLFYTIPNNNITCVWEANYVRFGYYKKTMNFAGNVFYCWITAYKRDDHLIESGVRRLWQFPTHEMLLVRYHTEKKDRVDNEFSWKRGHIKRRIGIGERKINRKNWAPLYETRLTQNLSFQRWSTTLKFTYCSLLI